MNLLDEYLALTDDAARATFLAGLTPDQLTELNTLADERFTELSANAPSDENVAALGAVGDALEAVAGEQENREQLAAQQAAEQQAIIDRIRNGGDPDPDGDPADAPDPEADPEADPAADPEADPEAAPDPEAVAEPIAAAGTSPLRTARPRISNVSARRPAQPTGTPSSNRAALVAAANVPGFTAGTTLVEGGSSDLGDLAGAIVASYNALAGGRGRQQAIVATARGEYPEDRILSDSNTALNMERIQRVMSAIETGDPAALTAAGGYCAPATIRYDLPTVGEDTRDVRDALPSFGAPRGSVRWMPSPQLTDVDSGAVDQWTEADDIAALTDPNVIKPCLRVECPNETDATLYAVTRCLEFGNFNARTFPELIDAYVRLVGVWQARFAEQLLLATIDTASIAVTSGQVLGATSDALAALDRLMMSIRSRYRVRDTRLRVILPDFFREMVRVDISRQIPGGMTLDERYAVADDAIGRWFAIRGANITWTLDSQVFQAQGVGPVVGFPSTVVARVYVEGTFGFLDGGTLDLGIVRDSTLNKTNDFQMFAENWEQVAKFGSQDAYKLTMDLCPDGSTSGTIDIDPCTTGS